MGAVESSWASSLEAEQSLLGGLLLDNSAYAKVAEIIGPGDFATAEHGAFYRAIGAIIQAGQPADTVTVADVLRRENADLFAAAGGAAYLGALAQNTPGALNSRRYAEIVRDRSLYRRLDALGAGLCLLARAADGKPAEERIAEARARVAALANVALPRHALRAMSAADFINLQLPELEPLLPPWLLRKTLCMVYAKRGVGKTYFALSLAYAVAAGASFLGWAAAKACGVLYVDGEVQAEVMQRRLRELATMYGDVPELFQLLSPDVQDKPMPDLATREGQAEIDAMVTADTGLIVLDNLSCLARSGGGENDADSWVCLSEWLLKHRREGRAVIVVHHAGKSGAQRGTSKREDLLDVVINLRRPGDYQDADGARFEVHFEKARSLTGDDINPIEARLQLGLEGLTWTHNSAATKTQDRIKALWEGGGVTLVDVAREVGCVKSHAHDTLKCAMEAGELARHYPTKPRGKSLAN